MELNRSYYTGDYTVLPDANYPIKRGDSLRVLANNGILQLNKNIDNSLWLFACNNDPLCVGMLINGIKHGSTQEVGYQTNWQLDIETIRPPINHYTVTWSNSTASTSPSSIWRSFLAIDRVGNGVDNNNTIPDVAPVTAIATKYCILYIECYLQEITNIDSFEGISGYESSQVLDVANKRKLASGAWIAYHVLLERIEGGLITLGSDVGNYVVTQMRASFYSGSSTNRSTRATTVRLGFDYGGKNIKNSYFNEQSVGWTSKFSSVYLPRNALGGGASAFTQGGQFSISVRDSADEGDGKNSNETVFAYLANPSFWKIMYLGYALNGNLTNFTFAIDNLLKLQSAFAAYRATGFYFTGTESTARTGDLDDPENVFDLHRGTVDSNGGVHPETDGHKDPEHPGLTGDPDQMHTATGYEGDDNIDPNVYVDDTPLTKPNLQAINVFNRTYAVTATQLRALADFLWNADDDIFTLIKEGLSLMGENPMNALIDCRLYPFDVTTLLNSSGSEQIVLGRVNTETYGRRLTSYDSAIINLGTCTFFKKFKNFLDYSPYTVARLYLPYCGIVEIDTQEFMGHEITIKMVIDVITGACTCFVYKDGIICLKSNGVIGVGIPMSGTDSASYANTILGNTISGVTDVLSGAAGIMGGSTTNSSKQSSTDDFRTGGTGVIEGFSKLYQNYQTPLSISSSGSASPSSENWLPQYPYFIIDEPIPNAPAGYGHSVGFACYETKSLSNYSGYTECSNVDTSGFSQATESERAELKMLLESGVFL